MMDALFDMVVKMVLAYQNWLAISSALECVRNHGTYKQVRSMLAKEDRAYDRYLQCKVDIDSFSGIPYSDLSKMLYRNDNQCYSMVERVWCDVQDYIIEHGSELKDF